MNRLARLVLAATLAFSVVATRAARGDDDDGQPPAIVEASASEPAFPDEAKGVERLFDGDDATSYCTQKKNKIKLSVTLSRATLVRSAHLSLGDPSAWKDRPRIKQVFVSVLDGDRLMKKVRHKWPDRDRAREGRINLDAEGTSVVVEIDQVYAGAGPGGLCLAGLRLEAGLAGASQPVDAADLAARAFPGDALAKALTRTYVVSRGGSDGADAQATLELAPRGRLTYRDPALALEIDGRWRLEPTAGGGRALLFDLSRARAARKRVTLPSALAKQQVPWRFGPPAEGQPFAFLPWIGYAVDESNTLVTVAPRGVALP